MIERERAMLANGERCKERARDSDGDSVETRHHMGQNREGAARW